MSFYKDIKEIIIMKKTGFVSFKKKEIFEKKCLTSQKFGKCHRYGNTY